ncbi:hypothetical protein K8I85_06975 [bacterium]|nr:hypothetical protein [bacterium]
MIRFPSSLRRWVVAFATAMGAACPATAQTGDAVDLTTLPNYPHGNFRADCNLCHDADSWSPARIGSDFHHEDFGQPLRGAHEGAPCLLCHITLTFAEATGTTCADCHTDVHLGEFGTECQDCHSTQSFDNRPDARRDHRMTRFPLSGAHASVECESCHNPEGGRSASYTNTPLECVACHRPDYEATRNPDHVVSGLPTECQDCHSDVSWSGGTFDHSLTRFPLTGAHRNADCQQCHEDFVFTAQPTDCYSCHQEDYLGATEPVHEGFPLDCAECHGTTTWDGAAFDHSTTAFPLTGAHNTVSCSDCHEGGVYAGTPMDCYACHEGDYTGATNPDHVSAGFSTDCVQCHSTASWGGGDFDHDLTGFPLRGAHVTVDCFSCHEGGVFTGTSSDCYACHQGDYDGTTNPDHGTAGFSTDCAACHNTVSWPDGNFDHDATAFPLTGAHNTVGCLSCHVDNTFAGTPQDCYSCHQADYEGTTDPDHVSAGFPTDCTECHGTAGWSGASFDHDTTGFPLTGQHVAASCLDCHVGGVFAGTATDCYTCHRGDYEGTTDPDHVAAGFSPDCAACHNTGGWPGATFNHDTTAFPLTGQHVTVDCASCHVGGVYTGTPKDCYSCHQADYESTSDPDHVAAGFPTDCTECHTTAGWPGATFDHDTTAFPLTGAHVTTSCTDCHVGGVFAGTPTDCYQCHQAEFDATTNPNHAQAGFSTACADCHNTVSWPDGNFDHDATAFPLTGAHVSASCTQCHVGGVFAGTATDCYSCHQADYDGTTDPNHVAAGFPTDCTECHNTAGWPGATFDHDATAFPLTGAHVTTSCADCHVGGVFAGTPTDCYQCHQSDFDGTTNPNHIQAGFSTACADCHNTVSWPDGNFDHDATAFPLTGAHVTASCTQCHVGGVFAGTSTDCYSCHQGDYDGTSDPNHVTAGFPTTCADCHGTTTWSGASFDHDTTGFPLQGAHQTVNCLDCHQGGVFAGTPNDCFSCHESDYNGVSDPNHQQLVYPHDCLDCHDMNGWDGARVDHDFPIYNGTHRQSRWNVCSTCHTNQGNYGDFSCLGCHPHSDRNKTDDDHRGENGYQYSSPACYDCHPDGQKD